MVSYRIMTLLALAATGAIAAPCEAGSGNAGPAGTAAAAAPNAQATGAAGNAQGSAGAGAGSCPPATQNDSLGPDNVGVDGAQFVTGQCTSDANCASNCCVLGGGSDKTIAVCRNEPALKPDESCGFTCA